MIASTEFFEIFSVGYLVALELILFQVIRDCRILGENWTIHLIPALLYSWIFYILWLFVWPGTLRLRIQGKRLRDTVAAKMYRRNRGK